MLRIFRNLSKWDGFLLLISVCLVVLQTYLDLKLPDYMSEITALIEAEGSKINDIASPGGKMLLCAVGSLCIAVLIVVVASRAASDFSADLRLRLFDKVQSFSMEEIGAFSAPSLIACFTDDVARVQILLVPGIQIAGKALAVAVLAGIKISGKAWQWTLAAALAVLILMAIAGICAAIVLSKFKDANMNQKGKKPSAIRTIAARMPLIQAIMSGLMLAVYWIGAVLINEAAVTDTFFLFTNTIIFSCYAMQIAVAFMMLMMVLPVFSGSATAAHRILAVLDTRLKITDGPGVTVRHGVRGEIEFRNVSFHYPNAEKYALHNISFTAHKGETVAFIGTSGCGKSTLLNLIPRFSDATRGEVLVDGVNVKNYAQKELRNRIGYVSQKAMLFTGTVKSNIAFGDNGKDIAMDQDMVDAAYTAQASEFVEEREGGYEGFVAQGGFDFSDGQKQCLSIARAICREPEIFLFDDSFSELDCRTERSLRAALRRDCKDVTKLITAQRIETVRDADRIVVLDDGNIVGIGTHEELMKGCEAYEKMASVSLQLSEEESLVM